MDKCDPDNIEEVFASLNDFKNMEDWEFVRERFLSEPLCINDLDKVIFQGGEISPSMKYLSINALRCDHVLLSY